MIKTEEKKNESFEESVDAIAEKIRTEEGQENIDKETDTETRKKHNLEKIRKELQESYGNSDDEDDEDDADGTIHLQPANLDESTNQENYLSGVEEKYKEPVANLVQSALHKGISQAISKAQRKNNPYLIDAFHDSLTHLLHQRMQEKGLL